MQFSSCLKAFDLMVVNSFTTEQCARSVFDRSRAHPSFSHRERSEFACSTLIESSKFEANSQQIN